MPLTIMIIKLKKMKIIILSISFLLSSLIGFSQTKSMDNQSKFNFGFNLGGNYSILQAKEELPNNAKISNGFGFNIGVFMDYSISESFLVSPKLELSLYQSSVDFENIAPPNSTYSVFPVSLNLMTHFVFKIGKGKMAPYIFVGPNIKIPISQKPVISTEFYTSTDFSIDFGIGLENKMKHFVFAPELKYSLGLLNVNQNPSLQTLNFHTISLLLNFK